MNTAYQYMDRPAVSAFALAVTVISDALAQGKIHINVLGIVHKSRKQNVSRLQIARQHSACSRLHAGDAV